MAQMSQMIHSGFSVLQSDVGHAGALNETDVT